MLSDTSCSLSLNRSRVLGGYEARRWNSGESVLPWRPTSMSLGFHWLPPVTRENDVAHRLRRGVLAQVEWATAFLSNASYNQTHLVRRIVFDVAAFNEGASCDRLITRFGTLAFRDPPRRLIRGDPNAEQLLDALKKGLSTIWEVLPF